MNSKKPVFLLAGGRRSGGKTPDPIIQSVLKEIGKASPPIAYIGAANQDDKRFFQFMKDAFLAAGAGKIEHALISPKKADLKKAQELLNSAEAIFISGGDVELGMQTLEEKNMADFLRELYDQGKFFFGLSAGSIMLASRWVRWRNPEDDTTAELFSCLGIAPVICDTHAEGDDWEELKAALGLEKDTSEGFGIATGTALKIYPGGKTEALGGPVCHYRYKLEKLEKLPDIFPAGG
jgi:peptidase E